MASPKIVLLSSSPQSSHITVTPPCRSKRSYSAWSPGLSPAERFSENRSFHELDSFNLPTSPAAFTTTPAISRHSSQDAALHKMLDLGEKMKSPITIPQKRKRLANQKSVELICSAVPSVVAQSKPKKRSAKKEDGPKAAARKPRKSKVKENLEADQAIGDGREDKPPKISGIAPSAKPIRKTRAKPTGETAQLKLPRGKITKVTAAKSQHFQDDSIKDGKLKGCLEAVDVKDLGLEKAHARRTDWTPTKPSLPDLESDLAIDEYEDINSRRRSSFSRDFYQGLASSVQPVMTDGASHGLVKRRQIELLTIGNQVLASPTKGKRAKKSPKKLQTVTAKATEQFQPEKTPSGILPYLSQVIPTDDEDLSFLEVATKLPRRNFPSSKVLPPKSALKVVQEQDLIYGTSSQLMREPLPDKEPDSPPIMIDSSLPDTQVPPRSLPSRILKSTSNLVSRGLWDAAARDVYGDLLYTDESGLTQITKASSPSRDKEEQDNPSQRGESQLQPLPSLYNADLTETLRPKSVAEAALRVRPKARSPTKKVPKASKPGPPPPQSAARAASMPNYEGFTIPKLQRAVEAFGFKAIKNRDTMISVLKQCWEGKQRLALQNVPPNIPMSVSEPHVDPVDPTTSAQKSSPAKRRGLPAKPKDPTAIPKPRGRPRKKTLGLPSAAPLPESQPLPVTTIPPPIALPPRPLTPPPTIPNQFKPPLIQPDLFPAIKEAIMTFPPTHDPSNLTWYEKILLYDPICVEDLAAWLNTVGLNRISVDEEVGPKTVKAWCESNSVCCLLKGEGWRAKRVKKTGGGPGRGRKKKGGKVGEGEGEVEQEEGGLG